MSRIEINSITTFCYKQLLYKRFYKLIKPMMLFSFDWQYYSEMLDSGIYVRDFGKRLEDIQLSGSG